MELAKIGDRIVVESEHVGEPAREGDVIEVLSAGDTVHYVVRWDDGHRSMLYPAAGSCRIVHRGAPATA